MRGRLVPAPAPLSVALTSGFLSPLRSPETWIKRSKSAIRPNPGLGRANRVLPAGPAPAGRGELRGPSVDPPDRDSPRWGLPLLRATAGVRRAWHGTLSFGAFC